MNKALPVCTEKRWRSGDSKAEVHLSALEEEEGGQRGGRSRSHAGRSGTAGGRDGCLEVTSEQRDETEEAVGRRMAEMDS